MTIDDVPTIAERYAQAIGSKRLVLDSRTRGDADYLIAAAKSIRLGALLLRLRSEFDRVRGDARHGPLNRTEMALILSRLKTRREAAQAFGEFAVAEATRRRYMQPDSVVMLLAGKALDSWLDPLCQHCDGRGFHGGRHRGEKRALCRECSGSGLRAASIGKDDQQRWFIGVLLCQIEQKMVDTERDMRRLLGPQNGACAILKV